MIDREELGITNRRVAENAEEEKGESFWDDLDILFC
jgi:hypothetical protein